MNPSATPFTSVESLIDRLHKASTPRQEVEIARDYVGFDAQFDSIVLFSLAQAWLRFAGAQSSISNESVFIALDRAWSGDPSAKRFIEGVAAMLTGNPRHDYRALADAAIFLNLKEQFPHQALQTILRRQRNQLPKASIALRKAVNSALAAATAARRFPTDS